MKYLDLVISLGKNKNRDYTKNKPKPLAKIGDYVFLDLLLIKFQNTTLEKYLF